MVGRGSLKKQRKSKCIGITNRVNVGSEIMYVPFLDYDNITYTNICKEISNLVMKWNLGWCYILKTNDDGRHYHVFCPTLITPYEYLGILWDSSCDMPYKKSFFVLKEKALRITAKEDSREQKFPEVAAIIKYGSTKPYSGGHISFIKKYYNCKDTQLPDSVNVINTDVEFVSYKTKHLRGSLPNKGVKDA
jgi:hypothetical protein